MIKRAGAAVLWTAVVLSFRRGRLDLVTQLNPKSR